MDLKTWSLLALSIAVLGSVSSTFHHSGKHLQARQAEVLSGDVETMTGGGGGGGSQCSITDAQADSTIAYLFTNGNSGRNAPETLSQLPAFCSDTRNKVTIVKNYQSKCLPTSQIQICLQAWDSTVDGRVDSFCRVPSNNVPTKEQAKLLAVSKCTNSIKPSFQQCIKDKICAINVAAGIRDERKRLATICCNLDSFSDCAHKAIKNGNPSKCSLQNANDWRDYYDNFRKCWTNCLCGDFTPLSDSCKAFRPSAPGRRSSAEFRTGGGGGGDCTNGKKSIVGAIISALKNVKVPEFSKRSAEAFMRTCK